MECKNILPVEGCEEREKPDPILPQLLTGFFILKI